MNKIIKVGRPLKFKSPEKMQEVIDEYFTWCDNRIKTIWDDEKQKEIAVCNPAPYTMHGLARALGVDRQTIINYENRDQFLDTIKKARERVAEDVETRLMDGRAQTGAIFNLKNNFGWKDETKSSVELNGQLIIKVAAYGNSDTLQVQARRSEPTGVVGSLGPASLSGSELASESQKNNAGDKSAD